MNRLPTTPGEWDTVASDVRWLSWITLLCVAGMLLFAGAIVLDYVVLMPVAWWKIGSFAFFAVVAVLMVLGVRSYAKDYAGVWGTYTVWRQGQDKKWRKRVHLLDKSQVVIMEVRCSAGFPFHHMVWRCPRPFEVKVFLGFFSVGGLAFPRAVTCGFLADGLSDVDLIEHYPGGEREAEEALCTVLTSTVNRLGKPELTYYFVVDPEEVAPWTAPESALVHHDTVAEAATATTSSN